MQLCIAPALLPCTLEDNLCRESYDVGICEFRGGDNTQGVVCEFAGNETGNLDRSVHDARQRDCESTEGCFYNRQPSCNFPTEASANCQTCLDSWGSTNRRIQEQNCLEPSIPDQGINFCPDGTTFVPDNVTPEIGRCQHACRSEEAWQPDHPCQNLFQRGDWDWNNNTCANTECDTHVTSEACTDSDGYWQVDEGFSERTCAALQSMWNSEAWEDTIPRNVGTGILFDSGEAALKVNMWRYRAGEFCCTDFDFDAWNGCSWDDVSTWVRPLPRAALMP